MTISQPRKPRVREWGTQSCSYYVTHSALKDALFKSLFSCRISVLHQDQPLFHVLDRQESRYRACHLLQSLTSWDRAEASSAPELPASAHSLTAFYPSSVWPHRCHLCPIPLNTSCLGSSGKPKGKSHEIEGKKKAFLRHDFFFISFQTLPNQTLVLEKSLTRKGSGHTQHGSELFPESAAPRPLKREVTSDLLRGKESGKEKDKGWGFGRRRLKCTMYVQLGWNSKRLTRENWAFSVKTNSPGNIFFDRCTSIKKHDDPDDGWWDEEGCI